MQRAAWLLTALRCRGCLAAPSVLTTVSNSPRQLRIAAFGGSARCWVSRPAYGLLPPSNWQAMGALKGQPCSSVTVTARRKASSDATAALEEAAVPTGDEIQGEVSLVADNQQPTDAPVKRRRRRKTVGGLVDAPQEAAVSATAAVAVSEAPASAGQVRSASTPASDLVAVRKCQVVTWQPRTHLFGEFARDQCTVNEVEHGLQAPDLLAGAPPPGAIDVWSGVRQWVVFSDLHVSAKCADA